MSNKAFIKPHVCGTINNGDIMHDKLQLLLDKINISEENHIYFQNGELTKIICDKNKENYIFVIRIDKILPLTLFLDIKKSLKSYFKTAKKTDLKLICSSFELENILFRKISQKCPIIRYICKQPSKTTRTEFNSGNFK